MRDEIQQYLKSQVVERFLRYVQIDTRSDVESNTKPSTEGQWDLLRLLETECRELGLRDVVMGGEGFVYATLPARDPDAECPAFGLVAHVDTSSEQPGDKVRPVRHEEWSGEPIRFADDPNLALSVDDCAELGEFVGDTIITASGRTLLGADDKAGVAEIMAAFATLIEFPELAHGKIVACFTTDEEIGRGTQGIDLSRLPTCCYTMDGSFPGELEDECFDAWSADLVFEGVGVHPGFAKGKMVNAATCCARYLAELPISETPENTDGRDGFYYVHSLEGGCERTRVGLIVRDFEESRNRERLAKLTSLKEEYEQRFSGLKIHLETAQQYQNMREVLAQHPEVTALAEKAITDAGLEVRRRSIRGGTDGSLLCQLGHPTPNIFAGGMLFHSRREWVAESALAKATETILHLARRWSELPAQ